MRNNEQYTKQHFLWILLWWLCLYLAIRYHSVGASGIFLVAFFISSTYKNLLKSFFIGLLCSLISLIPYVNLVFMAVGIACILFRIKFLLKHWRVLFVGMYAYGVHFVAFLWNGLYSVIATVNNTVDKAELLGDAIEVNGVQSMANIASSGITLSSFLVATFLAIVFHLLLYWIYKYGYSTDRAFMIMGLSPLIVLSTCLPFLSHLKIGGYDITGDSFLDADSISEAVTTLTGFETGIMGTAAHAINSMASKNAKEEEKTVDESIPEMVSEQNIESVKHG